MPFRISRLGINTEFDAEHGNPRDGVIALFDVARIEYAKSTSSPKHTRTEILNLRLVPTWTLNETRTDGESETPYIRGFPFTNWFENSHGIVANDGRRNRNSTNEKSPVQRQAQRHSNCRWRGLPMASPKP